MRSEDCKCAPDEAEGVDRGQLVGDIPTMMDGGGGGGVIITADGRRLGDTHRVTACIQPEGSREPQQVSALWRVPQPAPLGQEVAPFGGLSVVPGMGR